MAVDDLWVNKRTKKRTARYGRGLRYRVRWDDPETGKTRTESFDRKAEADRRDTEIKASLLEGTYIDPEGGKTLVRDVIESWRTSQLHDHATEARIETAMRLHVEPVIGGRPFASLRPSHIQLVANRAAETLEVGTVRTVMASVKALCLWGVRERLIGRSPYVGIRLPKGRPSERWIPTSEQVHQIARGLPACYRAAVYVAAGCGLRPGELFGLEVRHIDFDGRTLTIEQQLKKGRTGASYVARPKTEASYRTVELPSAIASALKTHLENVKPVHAVLSDQSRPPKVVERPVGLVFSSPTSLPVTSNTAASAWSRARTDKPSLSFLPTKSGWHCLRHYYATVLIHNGASVKRVSTVLGHSNPQTTLNEYLHEWPDLVGEPGAILDDELGTGI